MAQAIVFEAPRSGYDIDQIKHPMTVGELKELLADMDDDMAIICSHDNGYTYGSLSRTASIREEQEGEYGLEYEEIDTVSIW